MSHAGAAYRCFLPDLTRFTGSYCAGPQSLLRSHQRTTALFIILYPVRNRQSVSFRRRCQVFFRTVTQIPQYRSFSRRIYRKNTLQSGKILQNVFLFFRFPERYPASPHPIIESRSDSEITETPRDCAFVSLLPAASPASR